MSSKSNIINYITLILAILTIVAVFYTVYFELNKIYSILLLILTFIFSMMSRKINESEMNLKKEDREELEKSLNEIKRLKKK
ncbi:MAG: hypothetical protein Q4D02_08240 [Clostridia bacterium]|nr:hypothetical protein [Clostridia bacterium]